MHQGFHSWHDMCSCRYHSVEDWTFVTSVRLLQCHWAATRNKLDLDYPGLYTSMSNFLALQYVLNQLDCCLQLCFLVNLKNDGFSLQCIKNILCTAVNFLIFWTLFYFCIHCGNTAKSLLKAHASIEVPIPQFGHRKCRFSSKFSQKAMPLIKVHSRILNNKFSFLKEGLPSWKTAFAPCMLGKPPNLVIVNTALKPRHRRTLTIVIE